MRAFQRIQSNQGRINNVQFGQPAEGEVTVKVVYAGVNPFDMQVLRGEIGMPADRPLTLGAEATGILDGKFVQISGAGLGASRHGTFADFVVVPESAVRPLPEGADAAMAATVGVAGRTAWRAVHQLADVTDNDVVLVLGAGGGVGTFAAQLARATGAQVLAHTGSGAKADRLVDLGLEAVVADSPVALSGLVAGRQPTVVLDPLGGDYLTELMPVLRPGARAVSYGVLSGRVTQLDLGRLYGMGLRILGTSGGTTSPDEAAESLAGALNAVLCGKVVVQAEVISLLEAATAFERLSARDVEGKLLLQP